MTTAVISGSFDPPTLGHIDLILRALRIFDKVIVAIGVNSRKIPMFPASDRVGLLEQALQQELDGDDPELWDAKFEVQTTDKLLAEFAESVDADAIVRGVRTVAEYEAEMNMALLNRQLTGIETVLLFADPGLSFVSSSAVKEIAAFGGSVVGFVPSVVAQAMSER